MRASRVTRVSHTSRRVSHTLVAVCPSCFPYADAESFSHRTVRCVKIVPGKSHEVKRDRQDPTLSDTIRVLLLQQLAENSYLEDREKKALGVTA